MPINLAGGSAETGEDGESMVIGRIPPVVLMFVFLIVGFWLFRKVQG